MLPRGAVTPPATATCRDDRVERGVRRVEQFRHVDRGTRRHQPEPLVRLVPDRPAAHPAVAAAGRAGERADARGARRRVGRRPAAVRPRGGADDVEDRVHAGTAERVDDGIRLRPVVRGVGRVGGVRGSRRRDLVPRQREAHDLDADPLQLRDPVADGAGPVQQPRVVLQPIADRGRGSGRGRGAASVAAATARAMVSAASAATRRRGSMCACCTGCALAKRADVALRTKASPTRAACVATVGAWARTTRRPQSERPPVEKAPVEDARSQRREEIAAGAEDCDAVGRGDGGRGARRDQRAGSAPFASLVQLLETPGGERLVRFAYSTAASPDAGP